MDATVYIETSIPSAHVTTRTDPGSLYRRETTREWWESQLATYEPWTSEAVLLELGQGSWQGKKEALALMEPFSLVPIDDEVEAVAERYIAEQLVPADIGGDAIHLAAACVNEMRFLLTWNIRHLANPNKLDHLTVINRRLGLLTPTIVTPETLWLESTS